MKTIVHRKSFVVAQTLHPLNQFITADCDAAAENTRAGHKSELSSHCNILFDITVYVSVKRKKNKTLAFGTGCK